jgi:actin-related protein
MSEPMGNPDANREKLTRLMFETFKVPGFFLAVDGALAMISS